MSTVLHDARCCRHTPRRGVTFVEGDGVWLTDDAGQEYLDFAAGIAVVGLGHRHPAPLAAAHAQLDKLWHASNLYGTEPGRALAQRLSDRFGGAQAFFCNSGAEANEAALKYARKATGKTGVIALEQSFHGRTMGALSVTGQPAKRAAFEPLVPGARFAKPNDVESLRAAASDDVGLVLLEPVLGEGGVIPLSPEFLERRARSRRSSVRCSPSTRCRPGSGGPAASSRSSSSACDRSSSRSPRRLQTACRSAACSSPTTQPAAFVPGDHGSTFGANPVACAAAIAVCDTIDDGCSHRCARTASGCAPVSRPARRRRGARRGTARRRRARAAGAARSSTRRSTRVSSV